jgi:hypothetical protein
MDADTLANIDRLTAQVARLKGQLEAAETQAAEAWRELEAVYEAAKEARDNDWRGGRWFVALRAALAAVDARRGAVKP